MFEVNVDNKIKIHLFFLLFPMSVVMKIKIYLKKKNQWKCKKILGLVTNIEKYQKIYNHV